MALYALYENTGIRALLKKLLFNPIKNALHKVGTLVISKSLSREESINIARGLGEDILSQLIAEMSSIDKEDDESNDSVEMEKNDDDQEIKSPLANKYQQSNFFS